MPGCDCIIIISFNISIFSRLLFGLSLGSAELLVYKQQQHQATSPDDTACN
jgi:hypothetical protein